MLDACGAISVTERATLKAEFITLAKLVCQEMLSFLAEQLGFPLIKISN